MRAFQATVKYRVKVVSVTKKLVDHLARCDENSLVTLLGETTVALLKAVGSDAYNVDGLAYLVVSMHGEEGALRDSAIRNLLFSNLDGDEGRALCELLQFPTSAAMMTLKGVDFDNNLLNLEVLMGWYDVAVDANNSKGREVEGSRKAVANHKLRSHQLTAFRKLRKFIANPDTSVLVNMPFGAGKLRLVVTAVLDLYRSEPDGRAIVWLGIGEALCDEAFIELREVWEQIGSRDVTIYRVYGDRPVPDLGSLENCIIVADIRKLNDEGGGLEKIGRKTRVIVFSDAEHVTHPIGVKIIERFSKEGAISLVGISAISSCGITQIPHQAAFRAKFSGACITIDDEDPMKLLRDAGYVGKVITEIRDLKCGIAKFVNDNALEFDLDFVNELSKDFERNRCLLDLLLAESKAAGKVVFFATTAEHARLFAGLLALRGVRAMSVTSEKSPDERAVIIQRFNSRDEQILCVHGFFISGDSIPSVAVGIVAVPTLSASVFLGIVGRLASTKRTENNYLRIIVASDSLPVQRQLTESLDTWNKLDI